MFIQLININTTEKLVAQAIFIIGVIILVLGTYVTLYEADSKHADTPAVKIDPAFVAPDSQLVSSKPELGDQLLSAPNIAEGINPKVSPSKRPPDEGIQSTEKVKDKPPANEIRQEPIQPLPPKEDVVKPSPDATTEANKKSTSGDKNEKLDEEDIKQKEQVLEKREKQANKLIKELKEQKKEHQQILKEQKEVLEQMKEHVDADKAQEAIIDAAQTSQGGTVDNAKIDQIQVKQNFEQNIQDPQKLVQMALQPNQPLQQAGLQQNQNIPNANEVMFQQQNLIGNKDNLVNIPEQQPIFQQPQNNQPVQQQQPIIANQPLIPVAQQQVPVNQNQPINNVMPQPQNFRNPNQPAEQKRNPPQAYQAPLQNQPKHNPISQGVRVQNEPAPVPQQQQFSNNRVANNRLQQAQNPILQKQIVSNDVQQIPNQSPVPQQPVIQNQQPENVIQNQVIINQLPQNQVQNQVPQVPQQPLQGEILQNAPQQQPIMGNMQIKNQVPHQSQQFPKQNLAQDPSLENIIQNAAPNVHQPLVKSNVKLNEKSKIQVKSQLNSGKPQVNDQQWQHENQFLQHQKPIVKQNIKLVSNSQLGKENLQPYVESKGKVDVKRQTKASKIDNAEKLKVPGRDLLQAKDSLRETKVVKREVINESEEKSNSQGPKWVQYPNKNHVNFMVMASAGMGAFKSRNLLSDDNEQYYMR